MIHVHTYEYFYNSSALFTINVIFDVSKHQVVQAMGIWLLGQ